jgi:hypothetical protein
MGCSGKLAYDLWYSINAAIKRERKKRSPIFRLYTIDWGKQKKEEA